MLSFIPIRYYEYIWQGGCNWWDSVDGFYLITHGSDWHGILQACGSFLPQGEMGTGYMEPIKNCWGDKNAAAAASKNLQNSEGRT